MHRFRELKVWQRAMGFATKIYRVSVTLPPSERFGLTSQIRTKLMRSRLWPSASLEVSSDC